jgi:hypothetical protein
MDADFEKTIIGCGSTSTYKSAPVSQISDYKQYFSQPAEAGFQKQKQHKKNNNFLM